ncbi:MAG: SDR family oxidoreductase [Burkholderiaceae bacterium]|nr:SDR family oxidoreductase [Burkholderiaceae bacterium]
MDRLKELRAEIEAEGGAAHVVALDVTDYASIKSAIAHAETEAGPIDILINNSGVSTTQKLVDVTPEDYAYVMDTNQRGAFFVAQEAAKRMIARHKGDPKKQHRIINIASVAGLRVMSKLGIYCMSKAAVVQMTKAMALEWGKYGINVNAICPGYISTEINNDYFKSEQGRQLIESLPRSRLGTPDDLDGILLLLAAEESRFLNGSIVTADDGLSVA